MKVLLVWAFLGINPWHSRGGLMNNMFCVGRWGWSREDWLRRRIKLQLSGFVKKCLGPWFGQGGRAYGRGISPTAVRRWTRQSRLTYLTRDITPNIKIFQANMAWQPGVATQRGMAALFMWFCWSILSRSPDFTNVRLTDIISHCILQHTTTTIQPQSQILYHQIPKYIMN